MASNGGPNLIRVAVAATASLSTGQRVTISNATGTVEANGTWVITVIDGTHFDLVGSVFTNAWVSGGTISLTYSFDKWSLTLKAILPEITNFTSGGYQALLSGIESGGLTVSGPYNQGNMAFTVGNSYLWVLGFTASIVINMPGLIESIAADDNVKENPKITVTVKSSGAFLAAIV
jgi:hypothetical protein